MCKVVNEECTRTHLHSRPPSRAQPWHLGRNCKVSQPTSRNIPEKLCKVHWLLSFHFQLLATLSTPLLADHLSIYLKNLHPGIHARDTRKTQTALERGKLHVTKIN